MPGIGFAEMGPGDLGLSLGYLSVPRDPYPPEMKEARERVFAACRKNGIAFLENCSPANITARLDEGVRVISGQRPRHRRDRPGAPEAHDAGVAKALTSPLIPTLEQRE